VRFYEELTRRLEQVPGVRAVGASTALPIASWGGWGKYFTVDDRPKSRLAEVPLIQYREVTPHFAKALEVPVLEGRFFAPNDTADRPLVAVINESARRRFFPNEDPVGKLVLPNPPEATVAKILPSPAFRFPRLRIIGVIGDVKQYGVSRPSDPELFVPHSQGILKDNESAATKLFLFVKTDRDPLSFTSKIRTIVHSLDPEQPIADVATMEQRLKTSVATQQFQFVLFGSFAVVALALASVGIYGVLAYSVRLRMQEIGIRMALGASAPDILRMVVTHGLAMGIAGVLTGTVLGLGATRLMTSLLFEVQPNDAASFLGAALILMVAVAAASFVPARRAARLDPLAVIRSE
jgi:predicted permease